MTSRRSLGSVVAIGVLALAPACSKTSEATDAKRSPKPPPPAASTLAIGATVHVDVEIDGAPVAPIDGTRLAASKPDFVDDDHRAWRIVTLVGPAARSSSGWWRRTTRSPTTTGVAGD